MQPRERHRILVHVDQHNTLPPRTSAADVQGLEGLIVQRRIGHYELTRRGAIAVVQAGPNAMRPESGRVA